MSACMSALETLKKARELLSDETRWTRGKFARREDGMATDPESDLAVCWCAEGAIEAIEAHESDKRLARMWFARNIPADRYRDALTATFDFNDDEATSHADVLATFDRAIASLEAL